MQMQHPISLALTAAGLIAFSPAQAVTLVSGFAVDPGVTVSATNGAVSNHADQGIQGKGVNGEISGKEVLTFNWTGGRNIDSLQFGLLYNGPEFGDPKEAAKVSFYDADDSYLGFRTLLATLSDTEALWSGASGIVTNDSPAAQPGAGLWTVVNPFAGASIGMLTFEVATAACGTGLCNSTSDYIVTRISAVPEPDTHVLMLAGLACAGIAVRLRRQC